MKLSGNTVLITGGATGIGFYLAQEFLKAGNTVLICGRRENKLLEAQSHAPELKIKVSDIANPNDRKSLADWSISHGVNILINNAGIQREVDFKHGVDELDEGDSEIRVNLEGTIYLTALLIPHLMRQPNATIVNVSSGLGFIPIANMPIYCATKAAIHSFSVSLRHQLASAGIKVFEAIPPIVDTELDRGARSRRGQTDRGIPPEEAATQIFQGMAEDQPEIAIGMAKNLVAASRTTNFDQIFQRMNSRG